MNAIDRLKPLKDNDKYQNFADFIKANDKFLLTAHIRADGDAIGAICFLYNVLKILKKKVYPVLSDSNPDPKYAFLKGFENIHSIDDGKSDFVPQNAIILDSPTIDRTGKSADFVTSCPNRVFVDHHLKNESSNSLNLVDTSASSTCEILSRIIPYLNIPVTPELAETLYAGIIFDTGNFRFGNTSDKTLLAASALIKLGAEMIKVNKAIFYNWSLLKVKAMAQVLQSITLVRNNRIAISYIPFAYFQSNPYEDKILEGFSDLGLSIDGVRIGIFLREKETDVFKVSLRATGTFNVGSVAEQFGGGGHRKAAACKLEGTYAEVVEQLIQSIQHFNPRLNRKLV